MTIHHGYLPWRRSAKVDATRWRPETRASIDVPLRDQHLALLQRLGSKGEGSTGA